MEIRDWWTARSRVARRLALFGAASALALGGLAVFKLASSIVFSERHPVIAESRAEVYSSSGIHGLSDLWF